MSTPISAASYDTLDTGTLHVNPDTLYTAGLQLQATRDRIWELAGIVAHACAEFYPESVPVEVVELHAAWYRSASLLLDDSSGVVAELRYLTNEISDVMWRLHSAISQYAATDIAAAARLNGAASR